MSENNGQLRMPGFMPPVKVTGCKSRKTSEAERLARLWGKLIRPFGCVSEFVRACAEMKRLMKGDRKRNIRAYTPEQIERTILAMSAALKLAEEKDDFEFEVSKIGYLQWCCKALIVEKKKLGKWRRTLRLPTGKRWKERAK